MSASHGNQKVTDEEIISAIKSVREPVASASEVALKLDITRTNANIRMNSLRKEGHLERKKVGNGYVWWVASESESDK
jgi:predicted transcriptional regulator